jgi:hypothetical protein
MATYVFVAGGGWGGFIWRDVATRLREQGHDVFTPTLTGVGERSTWLPRRLIWIPMCKISSAC